MYLTNALKSEPYSNQKTNLNSGHAIRADETDHPHDGASSASNLSTILNYLQCCPYECGRNPIETLERTNSSYELFLKSHGITSPLTTNVLPSKETKENTEAPKQSRMHRLTDEFRLSATMSVRSKETPKNTDSRLPCSGHSHRHGQHAQLCP